MKLKKVSYRTLNPLHTYITYDRSTIYKVDKTYGDKNVTIAKYTAEIGNTLSDFAVYNLNEYISVRENDCAGFNVIDLGSKQYFVQRGDKLVFIDVDKAIEKLNRFIANIDI